MELGYTPTAPRAQTPAWLRERDYELYDTADYRVFDEEEESSRHQEFLTDLLCIPKERLGARLCDALKGLQAAFACERIIP